MLPFTWQGAGNGILHLASFDTLALGGLFQIEHIFSSSPIGRVLTYDGKMVYWRWCFCCFYLLQHNHFVHDL